MVVPVGSMAAKHFYCGVPSANRHRVRPNGYDRTDRVRDGGSRWDRAVHRYSNGSDEHKCQLVCRLEFSAAIPHYGTISSTGLYTAPPASTANVSMVSR